MGALSGSNSSPEARISQNYIAVNVYQCIRYASAARLRMGEDEVLVNGYLRYNA